MGLFSSIKEAFSDVVTIPGDKKTVKGYKGYGMKELIIEEGVEKIDNDAFCECNNIVSVTIPGSVKELGGFRNCKKLEKVIIKEGVERIAYDAFKGCDNLATVELPTSVPDMVFTGNCENFDSDSFNAAVVFNLKRIIIQSSEEEINLSEDGFDFFEEIVIENGAKLISGHSFFNKNSKTRRIVIPDSVEEISSGFIRYENLEEIIFGNGLKKISHSSFSGCYSLKEIVIPDSVTLIEDSINECENLKKIVIPGSVEKIEDSFNNCQNLEELILGQGVIYITGEVKYLLDIKDEGSFNGCAKLKRIIIPDSVKSVEKSFNGCDNLDEIILKKELMTLRKVLMDAN